MQGRRGVLCSSAGISSQQGCSKPRQQRCHPRGCPLPTRELLCGERRWEEGKNREKKEKKLPGRAQKTAWEKPRLRGQRQPRRWSRRHDAHGARSLLASSQLFPPHPQPESLLKMSRSHSYQPQDGTSLGTGHGGAPGSGGLQARGTPLLLPSTSDPEISAHPGGGGCGNGAPASFGVKNSAFFLTGPAAPCPLQGLSSAFFLHHVQPSSISSPSPAALLLIWFPSAAQAPGSFSPSDTAGAARGEPSRLPRASELKGKNFLCAFFF